MAEMARLSFEFVGHPLIPRGQMSNNKQKHTYIVDCECEGACVTGVRWHAAKSSQEVETDWASSRVLHCTTAIWHSRVHIIPAEYHTGCVGLWKVRVYFSCLVASKVKIYLFTFKYYSLGAMCGSSCTCAIQVLFLHHSISWNKSRALTTERLKQGVWLQVDKKLMNSVNSLLPYTCKWKGSFIESNNGWELCNWFGVGTLFACWLQ